ncbi:MAG: ferritin, partial [Rikenellaceae bacterium]|nr:ferritin [Rikenellaceae bacterium]
MLSQKLQDAINAQINAELWSAYLYLAMSMDAEAKGYKGVANWFFVQFQEEQDHARILMNYLNSRDVKVELKPIEAVDTTW